MKNMDSNLDTTVLNHAILPLRLFPKEDTNRFETLAEVEELWNLNKYSKGHYPVLLGEVNLDERDNIRVLDLPIKVPSAQEVILPLEVAYATDFVQQVVNYVHSTHFDRYMHSYAYLTTDSGLIAPSRAQRNDGLHVDGFEGVRIRTPLPTDFSFVVHTNDVAATKFYPYPFPCSHLDRAKDNFSAYWTQYARAHRYQPIYAQQNRIYGMNAYTMHEAGANLSAEPIHRNFLRLSFSVREYDRLGNTINPHLGLNWEFHKREIQKDLNKVFPELEAV